MIIIKILNNILKYIGAEIVRYPKNDLKRKLKMLNQRKINLIIDVGANKGEYTLELIHLGFKGYIESFEPISEAYKILSIRSKNNKNWNTSRIAIGDFDGESEINIAGNINSSSLLNMLPRHIKSEPNSKYLRKERILVNRLDTLFSRNMILDKKIFLKIDVQGYELNVLKGAEFIINNIEGIQIEMSLEPLYEGSILYKDMIHFLEMKGFELYSIENGFSDPHTGKLLQFDGVFFKK